MADSIYKSMEMKKECIILAGGEGRRAGAGLPKQFHNLGGVPLLWWSVRRFHEEDPSAGISVVLHPGFSTGGTLWCASCRMPTAR